MAMHIYLLNQKAIDDQRCVATTAIKRIDPKRELATWYDLWLGAVAIDAMCVRKGESGFSFGHGK